MINKKVGTYITYCIARNNDGKKIWWFGLQDGNIGKIQIGPTFIVKIIVEIKLVVHCLTDNLYSMPNFPAIR